MSDKKKFGFWSIVLLGINAIIGSGIFLLPNQAMKLIEPLSLGVIVFDMLLVISIAMCFAEVGGMFKKNGGPYVYAREAFGDFIGFEVGFMKWAISIIAWAAMAVAFATALGKLWPAALLIFYAFTGFESIAVAAEDMESPDKNIPKEIITVMIIVSLFYLLIQAISIGVLGTKLAETATPVADAATIFLGPVGGAIVTAGTLVSIGGINIAASFITPRSGVALAEDGLLPKVIAKQSSKGTPYVAIIITVLLEIQ
ncbi:APC family permease [Haloimpatiens sp. FM7315]|uniref:APC family permease n=1 Tax=Haloimpatiens sp. FM7315 TaxID=3298609 RepID=UPI0035A2B787